MLVNGLVLHMRDLEKDKYYVKIYEHNDFISDITTKLPIYTKDDKGVYRVFKKNGSPYKSRIYIRNTGFFTEVSPEFVKAKFTESEVQELFK